MEKNANMSQVVIDTINTIFSNLFLSIDTKLYEVLDKLTFINSDILRDKFFMRIFGTSASNGLLVIANALLIGFVIYFSIKYLLSNITFSRVENPVQFIFKLIIFGIMMNNSYFIVAQILDLNSNITEAIKSIGEDLFNKKICFSNFISTINSNLEVAQNLNVFTIEGLIKGTATISLINLVTVYALRYIVIKIFVLLSPFAILSLCIENTSWFFKLWSRNLFSMLLIQIIVAIVLLILFSIDYNSNNIMKQLIYVGGIYTLLKANTFVREFMSGSGISTEVKGNIGLMK